MFPENVECVIDLRSSVKKKDTGRGSSSLVQFSKRHGKSKGYDVCPRKSPFT